MLIKTNFKDYEETLVAIKNIVIFIMILMRQTKVIISLKRFKRIKNKKVIFTIL